MNILHHVNAHAHGHGHGHVHPHPLLPHGYTLLRAHVNVIDFIMLYYDHGRAIVYLREINCDYDGDLILHPNFAYDLVCEFSVINEFILDRDYDEHAMGLILL